MKQEKSEIELLHFINQPIMLSISKHEKHKAFFSEETCHAISSDWCHGRCQEESIDSAGFSIFNGVNGHLLSSDATAALFQMEAHVTPRLSMPTTSREARAQCPWLLTRSKVWQQRPRWNKYNIICIISLIKLGFISYSKKLSHWFSAYLGHDYHFPLGISENTHRLAVLVNWTSKR